MTALSQHTGIPYRRRALLDAGKAPLGTCAAVTRFGSPCLEQQMRLLQEQHCQVAEHGHACT